MATAAAKERAIQEQRESPIGSQYIRARSVGPGGRPPNAIAAFAKMPVPARTVQLMDNLGQDDWRLLQQDRFYHSFRTVPVGIGGPTRLESRPQSFVRSVLEPSGSAGSLSVGRERSSMPDADFASVGLRRRAFATFEYLSFQVRSREAGKLLDALDAD